MKSDDKAFLRNILMSFVITFTVSAIVLEIAKPDFVLTELSKRYLLDNPRVSHTQVMVYSLAAALAVMFVVIFMSTKHMIK